ncbi:type IV secretion system protein VirD2 [Vibrio cholerae]|nr:type IV secretion system protein VirD2 [Vibrio cholerae]GIA53275.1 type IV secretion system protein VirD2 [Vibrio cholerae]
MIYKEPEQKGGKHTEQTADALIKYVAYFGDCDRSFRFIPIT